MAGKDWKLNSEGTLYPFKEGLILSCGTMFLRGDPGSSAKVVGILTGNGLKWRNEDGRFLRPNLHILSKELLGVVEGHDEGLLLREVGELVENDPADGGGEAGDMVAVDNDDEDYHRREDHLGLHVCLYGTFI